MNDLHVITSNAPRGAEVFACALSSALTARGRGGDVIALTEARGADRLPVPAIHSHRARSLTTLRALRARANASRTVVGHGASTLSAGALACWGGPPFVYRVIGDPANWYGPMTRRVRVLPFLRRATRLVVLSTRAAEWLHAELHLDPANIIVIPNAVDTARFPEVDSERREAMRAQFALPHEAPVAVMIGALTAEKRVADAIRAVSELRDVRLLIAGDGPERAELTELAARLTGERTRFLGVVSDTAAVLAAADVLLLPSTTEGMPAALIEAALSGVPVVAMNVGDVAEMVPAASGLVVPPHDPLAFLDAIRVVLDGGAPTSAVAAREFALEHHSLDAVADQWLQVLESVD